VIPRRRSHDLDIHVLLFIFFARARRSQHEELQLKSPTKRTSCQDTEKQYSRHKSERSAAGRRRMPLRIACYCYCYCYCFCFCLYLTLTLTHRLVSARHSAYTVLYAMHATAGRSRIKGEGEGGGGGGGMGGMLRQLCPTPASSSPRLRRICTQFTWHMMKL
jgi:hypothetical protein